MRTRERERERVAGKEEYRIFVGGLSWDITEWQLENAFNRYGKILECQVMLERDRGRPRGFGFITYADRRAMDDAIREMHGRWFGDRLITVNKAQPRMGDDSDHGYRGGYSSGGKGGYRGGERSVRQDDCFKCGLPGHWAQDCPSAGGSGGGGGSFASCTRFGGTADRGDRDRFINDHYDGVRYGDRDRLDSSRDNQYGSRYLYMGDRYQRPAGDCFTGNRYGASDCYDHLWIRKRQRL